jgi:hypothetical protein
MTAVLDLTVLLQLAPEWMTQPGFKVALLLVLTVAALAILWDEFRGPERANSDGASDSKPNTETRDSGSES